MASEPGTTVSNSGKYLEFHTKVPQSKEIIFLFKSAYCIFGEKYFYIFTASNEPGVAGRKG